MNESESSSLNESPAPYGADDLDFLDWSGHLPPRSRVSADKWLAYCRSNLAQLRRHPGYRESRLQDGIAVEFIL